MIRGSRPAPEDRPPAATDREPATARARWHGAAALRLFVLCFLVYNANCRTVPFSRGGDTIPTRLVPFALLAYGTPALDGFRSDFQKARLSTWYLRERRGSLVSFYPIGAPLAALPVYVPVYALLAIGGRPPSSLMFALSEQVEKLASSLLVALSVVMFYLTIRRRAGQRAAFGAALVFGVGSCMWAIASQMLWQQTVVAVTLTAALWLLDWPDRPPWTAAAAGFALSLAAMSRLSAALLLAAGLCATLLAGGDRRQRVVRAVSYLGGALPLVLLGVAINLYYWGQPAAGYGTIPLVAASRAERLLGIAGLLVSPNRGLLVFTPIAALGIWGLLRQVAPGRARDWMLIPFGVAALIHLLVMGSYPVWWGGWAFGPRYLVDVLPVLGLATFDVWSRLGDAGRRVAGVAIVCGVLVQVNGAFCFPASRWDWRSRDPSRDVWNVRDFELVEDFRAWLKAGRWSTPY